MQDAQERIQTLSNTACSSTNCALMLNFKLQNKHTMRTGYKLMLYYNSALVTQFPHTVPSECVYGSYTLWVCTWKLLNTTLVTHYIVKMTHFSSNPSLLLLSLSSGKTKLLSHRRNSAKEQRNPCRNPQEVLARYASKHVSRLLHKNNRNNFQSYRAENLHAIRQMSDLAFRATNSPSCLELMGGSEGFSKVS